ncbi:MAG: molybdopterin-dependent oxidoreductase [Deltaproteobacteria bacterium]|nr:molybdopterin-dependent oxidoreductase [Deltaproteobacteria bacterium]MBW2302631.1 molybdopterin-dependent oxidoreductase [Deltaproteobacteria bacterium]
MDPELMKSRARRYQFLSALYRDEIPLSLIEAMQKEDFLDRFNEAVTGCGFIDLSSGAELMTQYLKSGPAEELYKELRYDYADLFLNAGPNPVFPYESVIKSGEPVVMQEPVFELRKYFRRAGVRKNPNYKDLEEHIAVQMELLRILLERGDEDLYLDFFKNKYCKWVPAFCDQLIAAAPSKNNFYQGLAAFTRGALMCESLRIEGFTRGEETTKKMLGAVDSLGLDPGYVTLEEGPLEEEPEKKIPSHCYTCGALCGITARLKDGILVATSGLQGDPKSGGRICPKGAAAPKHLYSAYRLKTPLIKEDGRFRKATWDEALDRVVEAFGKIEQGKIGYMRGNDWANNIHEALFDHLGCPKTTHRPMCDNSNRMANEKNLNDKRPWINYQEADYILHFGMNELATSYGQRKTAELRAALRRGAKLVVFDPRRSETASAATEWIPIKPSTDAAVAMAMAYVIIKNELYDKEFVENWTHGFEEFKKRVLGEEDGVPRDPEWGAKISGVPKETIERIAMEFASARNKGCISWTGLAQTPNGMYATAAIQALNALCGTFDAPGGPSLPFKRKLKSPWGKGQEKPPAKEAPKLNKFGIWSGWAPAYLLADVEAGKLKGMINYFGDPVLSWGNQEAITRAIEKMEFVATIDAFMCNTALLSDVILPDATWLEQSQVKADWMYEAFIAYYAEVVPPMYDSKPMFRITVELAKKLGLGKYFPWESAEEAERNQLEGTPWSYDELKEKGFIVTDPARYYKYKNWGSFNVPEGYGSSGKTSTGKYNFLNPVAREKGIDPLPDYKEPDPEILPDDEFPFIFGNFRLFIHEHSSTFNNYQLMKAQGTNPLWINKLDAQERGIEEGDRVRLSSPWGAVELRAHPTWGIMRGVLGSAGGFGHIRGLEGDPKYPQFRGVNAPGIMKPNYTEDVGGTPLLKYIKVKVEKM